MKIKHYPAFMKSAQAFAEQSKCTRLKVGCVIVKDGAIISTGWNGMLPGVEDDACEDSNNVTKSDCLHAERNAINKLARSTMSGEGSTVFVTHAPCRTCATDLLSIGVKEVVYESEYRSTDGLDVLKKNGVLVKKYPVEEGPYICVKLQPYPVPLGYPYVTI